MRGGRVSWRHKRAGIGVVNIIAAAAYIVSYNNSNNNSHRNIYKFIPLTILYIEKYSISVVDPAVLLNLPPFEN